MCCDAVGRRVASGWRRDPPDKGCGLDRLRRKRDLEKVFEHGRRCYAAWVVAQVREREPDESAAAQARVAVVAGRKLGNAVTRNRAKRLLRETCRAALGGCVGPWDIILIARASILSIPLAERVSALSALFHEVGVLPGKAAIG
jgi:ribonuclease P protein component